MSDRIERTDLKKSSYSGYQPRLDFSSAQKQEIYKNRLKKPRKTRFMKALILFLFIGLVLLYRRNIIQIKVITTVPRKTFIGEGIFIQSYEKCSPRIKVAFNLPEGRCISKTEQGYLVKVSKFKIKLEIITLKPKITIMGRNVFVQSFEHCPPRFKFSVL